jgi:hypothetical protein
MEEIYSCFPSFRGQLALVSWIRIRILNPNPEPHTCLRQNSDTKHWGKVPKIYYREKENRAGRAKGGEVEVAHGKREIRKMMSRGGEQEQEELGGRYTVKKVLVFPVPSRDVTNQTLPGRE